MAEPLVIFGNGQMAEFAYVRFRRDERFEVAGFTVDRAHLREPRFCGLPIVPFEEVEQHFPPSSARLFISVGPVLANRIRAERFLQARALGYRFASYVSTHALVDPEVPVGENCSIGENAVVQALSRVGDNVRIGSGSLIGHHCVIGDHSFLGVGCVLAGSVHIGARTFIGVNATIRDRVKLGEGCVIGAGAVIVRDTAPGSVHVAPDSVVLPISGDRLKL